MFISNVQFVKRYFLNLDNIDLLLEKFYLIRSLLRKYSFYLKKKEILDVIKKNDEVLYSLFSLLRMSNKLNINDIDNIIKIIKKFYPEYKKQFILQVDKRILHDIESIIENKFKNVEIKLKWSDILWANVKWEWYFFKKYLEKDISRLLKI